MTLAFKFFAGIAAVFVVAISVLLLVQYVVQQNENELALETKGTNLANLLSRSAVRPILTYNFILLKELATEAIRDEEVVYVTYFNPGGNIIGTAGEAAADQEIRTFKSESLAREM